MSEELNIELGYTRRYVTGPFQHKEYSLKLSGKEKEISSQIADRKIALAQLMSSVEGIVTLAHEAQQVGKTVDEIVNVVADTSKPKSKSEASGPASAEKKSNEKLDDIF
jgi:hypothetical protein